MFYFPVVDVLKFLNEWIARLILKEEKVILAVKLARIPLKIYSNFSWLINHTQNQFQTESIMNTSFLCGHIFSGFGTLNCWLTASAATIHEHENVGNDKNPEWEFIKSLLTVIAG